MDGSQEQCSLAILLPKESPELDPIVIYDGLINDHLANLSDRIPGHTRVQKESAVRKLAADLLLARINVVASGGERDGDVANMRSSPAHGQVDSSGGPSGGGTDFSALLALTTVDERKRPLSNAVTDVLAHWQPGTDPGAYDWQSVSQRLSQGRDPSRRVGSRKRKGKQAQSSETTVSRASSQTQELNTLPPPVSQPQPQGQAASSQGAEEPFPFPMTQTERGVFGSRRSVGEKKKKNKKRTAGF